MVRSLRSRRDAARKRAAKPWEVTEQEAAAVLGRAGWWRDSLGWWKRPNGAGFCGMMIAAESVGLKIKPQEKGAV